MVERRTLAIFWIFAGVMHFVIPKAYRSIVPAPLARWRNELVVASGLAEIAGGLLVLPDATRRGARWWLLATLAAVYPANVQMALNPEKYPDLPPAGLWARLPLQFLFALHVWRGTR